MLAYDPLRSCDRSVITSFTAAPHVDENDLYIHAFPREKIPASPTVIEVDAEPVTALSSALSSSGGVSHDTASVMVFT